MTDEDRIEIILKKLVENSPGTTYIDHVLQSNGDTEKHAYSRITKILESKGLAKPLEGDRVATNAKTFEIVKSGGYKKYLESIEAEKAHQNEKEELEYKSMQVQYKLNKNQVKTMWFSIVLSILALIVAVLALIK